MRSENGLAARSRETAVPDRGGRPFHDHDRDRIGVCEVCGPPVPGLSSARNTVIGGDDQRAARCFSATAMRPRPRVHCLKRP